MGVETKALNVEIPAALADELDKMLAETKAKKYGAVAVALKMLLWSPKWLRRIALSGDEDDLRLVLKSLVSSPSEAIESELDAGKSQVSSPGRKPKKSAGA